MNMVDKNYKEINQSICTKSKQSKRRIFIFNFDNTLKNNNNKKKNSLTDNNIRIKENITYIRIISNKFTIRSSIGKIMIF